MREKLLVLARRRCLACDTEQDVLEEPDTDVIGPACRECRAPTERVEVIASRLVAKNPHAAELGRLGGLKGGPARAKALTAERRQEIARRAIQARWKRAR